MSKRILALIIVLAISLAVVGIFLYKHVNMNSAERQYQKTGKDADLVLLLMELHSSDNHAKMIEYVPQALKKPNMIEAILESHIPGYTQEAEAKRLYEMFLARMLMSYIYEERYEEYEKIFPELYGAFIKSSTVMIWSMEAQDYKDAITKEGGETVINSFHKVCPNDVRYPETDMETIREYDKNRMVQRLMYNLIGQEEKGEALEKETGAILREILKNIKKERIYIE
ncbi:MAG: hypothetical protein ACOYJD_09635 [Christensenellales bacterium]|jgi:hypothetical protein